MRRIGVTASIGGIVLLALLMPSCFKERAPRELATARAPVARQSAVPQAPSSAAASPQSPARDVLKLYKRATDGRLAYHEAWLTDSGITEHWGPVGERGETRDHPPGKTLDLVLAEAKRSGFSEIDSEHLVVIEYGVNGMGTTGDLEKRYALQERMDETLGWTGLGHCDGGSIGSGTMEVAVLVVDVDLAKRVIAADLRGTPFQDYTRIYVETPDSVGQATR
jgi:hypothetical protein